MPSIAEIVATYQITPTVLERLEAAVHGVSAGAGRPNLAYRQVLRENLVRFLGAICAEPDLIRGLVPLPTPAAPEAPAPKPRLSPASVHVGLSERSLALLDQLLDGTPLQRTPNKYDSGRWDLTGGKTMDGRATVDARMALALEARGCIAPADAPGAFVITPLGAALAAANRAAQGAR